MIFGDGNFGRCGALVLKDRVESVLAALRLHRTGVSCGYNCSLAKVRGLGGCACRGGGCFCFHSSDCGVYDVRPKVNGSSFEKWLRLCKG